jgi:hypothetical protein
MNEDYIKGIEDTIAVIEERGKRIGGAMQAKYTIKEIREKLMNEGVRE